MIKKKIFLNSIDGIKELYKVGNDTGAVKVMEQFIKLAKDQIEEVNLSSFEGIEYIIEDLINNINISILYRQVKFGTHYIHMTLDYVGFIMDRYPNAITEFGFISHLYQLTQKDKGDRNLTDELKHFFDKRIHKEEADITSFEAYREKLDSFTKMPEDEFESFINTAIDYRNKTGMFPENVCDYIIKQCILGRFNNYLTKEIKERVIEDKTEYLAKDKCYNDTIAVCGNASDQFIDQTSGKDVSNGYFAPNGLIRLRTDKYSSWFKLETIEINGRKWITINILSTLFHEMRHNDQPEHTKKYYYNPFRYKMFKEGILRNHLPQYSDKNYYSLFEESDASIYSDIDTVQYLKKLKFTEEELREAGLSDFEEIAESNVLEELSDEESADLKFDPILNKYRNFEDILQDLLKSKKRITIFINHQLLKYEYDIGTGERKGDMEFLEKYQDSELSEKLYPTIIKDGATVTNEKMLENIEKILTFTPEYPETEKLRNYILREKILPRVREWAEKGKVDLKRIDGLSEEEMEAGEKNQFEIAKDSLIKFARLHPEFSKDIEFFTMPEGARVASLSKDIEFLPMLEGADVSTSLSNIKNLFSPEAFLKSARNAPEARSVLHSLKGNEEKENGGDNKENVEGEGRKADEQ